MAVRWSVRRVVAAAIAVSIMREKLVIVTCAPGRTTRALPIGTR